MLLKLNVSAYKIQLGWLRVYNSKISALALLLKESFRVDDESFGVFVRTIDGDNFKQIISDIKEVNGIEEVSNEGQGNNSGH